MVEHAPLPGPLYFTLGRTDGPVVGYTWRVWSSKTSFYLKSRAPHLSQLKLSLHGDDPRHPQGGGFKLAMDPPDAFERDVAAGKIVGQRHGQWPVWFPGRPINEDATLVLRFRWTWDAVVRLGAAPEPGKLKEGASGLAIPPPPEAGDAVDVDFIVSKSRPYWPREPQARRDNACLGPLRNDARDWLTGTVIKRRANHYPPPSKAIGPRPIDRQDQIRAIASAADPSGFLWLVEQRMSKSALASPST